MGELEDAVVKVGRLAGEQLAVVVGHGDDSSGVGGDGSGDEDEDEDDEKQGG